MEKTENIIKEFFKCQVCNSYFKSTRNLNNHISSVHEGKKPFQCDTCNYVHLFYKEKHVALVHEEKKPFKCDICDYSCT